jgi:hypothetical protein
LHDPLARNRLGNPWPLPAFSTRKPPIVAPYWRAVKEQCRKSLHYFGFLFPEAPYAGRGGAVNFMKNTL